MKIYLDDLVELFIYPRKFIKRIIVERSIISTISVIFTMGIWYSISQYSLSRLFFGPVSEQTIPMIVVEFIFNILGLFIIWLTGYLILASVAWFMRKQFCYLKLLVMGGYLSILGMPFWSFYKMTFNFGDTTKTVNFIDEQFVGALFPILYAFGNVLARQSEKILWFSYFVNLCFFVWIFFVTILAVREIYKFSSIRSFLLLSISSTLLALFIIIARNFINIQGVLHIFSF